MAKYKIGFRDNKNGHCVGGRKEQKRDTRMKKERKHSYMVARRCDECEYWQGKFGCCSPEECRNATGKLFYAGYGHGS